MTEHKFNLVLKGVNALSGLISFLRCRGAERRDRHFVCQCPKRAYLISTTGREACVLRKVRLCQCPKRAYLISTILATAIATDLLDVCQCPKRAYLISTLGKDSLLLPLVSVSMP